MSSFGKLRESTNTSSSAPSFNPLELLNKLRSDGGQESVVKTRRAPMESPMKAPASSPLPNNGSSGFVPGSKGYGSDASVEMLSIAAGETNEAFEQRIRHFKELQEMNAEIHRLRKQNKKLVQEKEALRVQMEQQKSRADSTIAQLRAKLATPSKAYRNMQQFPTFGPPKKPFHSAPSSSNTRGLRSPEPPSPVRGAVAGAPSFFVPTYPSTDYNDDIHSMRSPYQDPTFNAMMRMSTPSQGIYGDGGQDAYIDMLRRGATGHMDPAMMMRMQQQQQQQQQKSNGHDLLERTNLSQEEGEEDEIYHIDLSN